MRRIKHRQISWKMRLYIVALLVLIASGVGFWFSPYGRATVKGIKEGYQTVVEKSYLVLGQVEIEGHARTQASAISEALEVKQNMPIFDIDLRKAQERLLKLPWVKKVVIERHLPSTLFIRIEEKEPIAVWQNKQKYFPLDAAGVPIDDDKVVLADLILVVGQDAPKHAPALIELLKKYPDIYSKVRVATRKGGRRWDLILNDVQDGIEVNLPETDVEYALSQFQKMIQEDKLMKRDLKRINLLHRDRLIVRKR